MKIIKRKLRNKPIIRMLVGMNGLASSMISLSLKSLLVPLLFMIFIMGLYTVSAKSFSQKFFEGDSYVGF
jgi:hypothetical protein